MKKIKGKKVRKVLKGFSNKLLLNAPILHFHNSLQLEVIVNMTRM